eukprot:scaffold3142_cov416-Prasinococcus_capsulatus_cf.AAC.7
MGVPCASAGPAPQMRTRCCPGEGYLWPLGAGSCAESFGALPAPVLRRARAARRIARVCVVRYFRVSTPVKPGGAQPCLCIRTYCGRCNASRFWNIPPARRAPYQSSLCPDSAVEEDKRKSGEALLPLLHLLPCRLSELLGLSTGRVQVLRPTN